jgi:hypothetical protein
VSVKVTLDDGELMAARTMAAIRELGAGLQGRRLQPHVGSINPHADSIAGACAELALAKHCNVCPDFSARVDQGVDLVLHDGVRVDVKAIHRRRHNLVLPIWTRRPAADIFVVGVVWPLHVVELVGWLWVEEAVSEERIGRLDGKPEHPESYIWPLAALRPMAERPSRVEAAS